MSPVLYVGIRIAKGNRKGNEALSVATEVPMLVAAFWMLPWRG